MKQLIKWEEAALYIAGLYTAHPAYGLKYFTGFQDTYLGKIGKQGQTSP